MVASLKIQSGGVWRTVADGTLRLQVGDAWVYPSSFKIQSGGVWRDSGYSGFPSPPTSFAVNAWDYDSVSVKWVAGVGGSPVSGYDIQLKNSANTVTISTQSDTASPSADFAVVKDTKYQLFIRSKTSTGQVSDWVGPLKIAIGHAAFTTYTDDPATRAYSLSKSVIGYKDAAVGPTIPTSVDVQTIQYNITNDFSGVLSPYGTHSISRWGNSAEKEQFSWLSQSVNVTVNVADYASNGGVQGMICRGTGWSTAASGSFVATGTITVNGIEHYTAHNPHSNPAVANGYW